MAQLTISMNTAARTALDRIAKNNHIKVGALCRIVLMNFLNKHKGLEKKAKNQKQVNADLITGVDQSDDLELVHDDLPTDDLEQFLKEGNV